MIQQQNNSQFQVHHLEFDQDTTYNFSIKAVNSTAGCESDAFTGSISVLNGHNLQLLSGSSSVDQTLCEGEVLEFPISYEFGGGALSARVLGLPPGVQLVNC